MHYFLLLQGEIWPGHVPVRFWHKHLPNKTKQFLWYIRECMQTQDEMTLERLKADVPQNFRIPLKRWHQTTEWHQQGVQPIAALARAVKTTWPPVWIKTCMCVSYFQACFRLECFWATLFNRSFSNYLSANILYNLKNHSMDVKGSSWNHRRQ